MVKYLSDFILRPYFGKQFKFRAINFVLLLSLVFQNFIEARLEKVECVPPAKGVIDIKDKIAFKEPVNCFDGAGSVHST